jgi:glycosyltransferase involved in cell wall biosynthesis
VNILIATETYLPYISGVAVSTDSIARYMASQGHTVTVVAPTYNIDKPVTPMPGLKIVRIPSIPNPFYKGMASAIFPFCIPPIEKVFKEQKFDIVHIQEPTAIGISALILAKKYKIPIVGALHFTPEQISRMVPGKPEKLVSPIIRKYINIIYNKYDAIMVPTQTFAEFLKKNGVKKHIEVVSNGVDTDIFHPAVHNEVVRKKLGIGKDDVVFFFLGRLELDKNVITLIKAAPFVGEKMKLLIVGTGKIEKTLRTLARKLNVEDRIIWVKHITDAEMPDYYHAADCFTIMSPYEVQSIVTLQAIASGLPIIAARAGALPELCRDHKNGFLVDTYDIKTLAARMDELYHNKKMRTEFGAESRIISLAHNKRDVLHKLELLYKSLITKR